ncbi:MAG: endonuclease domain-containing protein [Acidobacteria bacterium]|nr:endonuclease domain-containing protein [Acidobacteriota bacterium]
MTVHLRESDLLHLGEKITGKKGSGKKLLEEQFFRQLKHRADIAGFSRQLRFSEQRDFKFDFSWSNHKLACEIDGGIWSRGGHVRGLQFISDCEKRNLAQMEGWRVLTFTSNDVKQRPGLCMQMIDRFLFGSAIPIVKPLYVAKSKKKQQGNLPL